MADLLIIATGVLAAWVACAAVIWLCIEGCRSWREDDADQAHLLAEQDRCEPRPFSAPARKGFRVVRRA